MNKKAVFSNLIWRFAERTGAQLVSLIVSIVLARLLDPSSYGTVALILSFTAILQVFVDSGLGNALIQKKNADDLDFSSVFYVNLVFCFGLYCLLFLFSPLIADFYRTPELANYIRVLGVTILISGIKNVQQAYVSRNLLFKKFFFATLIGTIIAGVSGVALAIAGYGIWALIAQQLINLTIDTMVLWLTVKWRPIRAFSFARIKALFSYGWKLLVAALIETANNNLRSLIIGKVYTSADLGYYNQGEKFPKMIAQNANASIDSVLLPVLSNVQDDKESVKSMMRRSIGVSTYVMAPLMLGMFFCAKSIVSFLLTEKWIDCVFYLRLFCLSYVFYPIHTANLNAIKAIGRSGLFLKLEVVKKIVGIIALIISVFISVEAMAVSMVLTSFVCQVINAYPNKRLLNYGYIDQIKDIIPSIFAALVMGMCVYPIQLFGFSNFTTLCIQIPLGALLYIALSNILHISSYYYLLGVIKSFRDSFSKK